MAVGLEDLPQAHHGSAAAGASDSYFPYPSPAFFVPMIYLLRPFCYRLSKFKPAVLITDINPCPHTVCLHVQLDHFQILNYYIYLEICVNQMLTIGKSFCTFF